MYYCKNQQGAIKISEIEPLNEDLIVRSAGYLKLPKKFREEYPLCVGMYTPTPIASMSKQEGKVHLIYTWNEEEIKE